MRKRAECPETRGSCAQIQCTQGGIWWHCLGLRFELKNNLLTEVFCSSFSGMATK